MTATRTDGSRACAARTSAPIEIPETDALHRFEKGAAFGLGLRGRGQPKRLAAHGGEPIRKAGSFAVLRGPGPAALSGAAVSTHGIHFHKLRFYTSYRMRVYFAPDAEADRM